MAIAEWSRRSFLGGLGASLLARNAWAGEEAGESFVLSNARILVGDGTELTGGIRVEKGRIVEVGAGVKGGRDLGGAILWPGLFNAGSPLGLWEIDLEGSTHDETEGSDPLLPQARVADAYNPQSEVIPVTRLGGIMGNLVFPGGGRLISGQAAWLRLYGNTVAEATILEPAGICINLGHGGTSDAGPKNRMGVALKLRDTFDANKAPPPPDPKAKKNPPAPPPPPETAFQTNIRALLSRKTKALLVADKASDLMVALDLAKAYNLDAILVGGTEGHLVAKELAAAGYPLLLGSEYASPSSYDTLHARYDNPALLHQAGVRFAYRCPVVHNLRESPVQLGVAVAYGLPWEVAIAAAAGNGPSFWGLKVGLLKVGYEATFAQTNGDPLQPRTAVTGLWFQGVSVPLTSRQTALYEKYKVLK